MSVAGFIELFSEPSTWIALLSLTALEIVLGIDNIVFIAILTDRLPEHHKGIAYRLGLGGAMITRIGLLLAISWVMGLTDDLFTVLGEDISGRDIILLVGGIFLIGKSTHEIYEKVETNEAEELRRQSKGATLAWTVVQISVLDIVFSLDSVITAVGVAEHVEIMVIAIVVAIIVMLVFARIIGEFVNKNPSMKILALSFLLLIGVLLTVEAFDQHINKGYIYFAMGFSLLVELLNMRLRRNTRKPAVERD